MIKALAPRVPRGCSWVCLSIALVFSLAWWAEAQTSKPAGSSKKTAGFAVDDDEDAPAPAKEAAKKKTAGFAVDDDEDAPAKGEGAAKAMPKGENAEPPEEGKEKPSSFEVFKDPVAEDLLKRRFSQIPAPGFTTSLARQVREMATGTANPDREVIGKFITGMASDLTNPTYFKAVVDPAAVAGGPRSKAAYGIRDATTALIDPLETARRLNNAAFLSVYDEELVRVLAKVLDNNLLARIEASIVLGQTGSPEVLDLFVKQLNDRKQTVWVKLWAARGITNIVQTPTGNRVDQINGAKAIAAAKALADFLNREKDAPWPARLRALEALGSLRYSASPTAQSKVEMADAALRILADPEVRPEVRAEAAWALSMMRISPAANRFNYPLIAHYASEVAADLGERVAGSFETNPTLSEYWTTFLIYKIYPAFYGQEGVSESGLTKMPNVSGPNRNLLKQTADVVQPLARGAVDLLKAPKGQQPQLAKDLGERVGTLRAFLDKNPPASTHLVPGDSGFPLKAQVAEAPARKTRVAGAAGDR